MNNESVKTKKLALTAIFAAVAVVGSMFSFPVFGSKCAPVQHMVNVLCAVFLGPGWGLAASFIASLIRNLTGLGTPLAFPGSMCGALLSGLLYKQFKVLPAAWIGEVFGTAVIGGDRRNAGLPHCLRNYGQRKCSALYLCGSLPHQHSGRNHYRGSDHAGTAEPRCDRPSA